MQKLIAIMLLVASFTGVGHPQKKAKTQTFIGDKEKLELIFLRFAAYHKAEQTMRAVLTVDIFSADSGITTSQTGELLLIKNKVSSKPAFRMNFENPTSTISTVDGRVLYYIPELDFARSGSLRNDLMNTFSILFSRDLNELSADYGITFTGESTIGEELTWQIRLTPKSHKQLSFVDVWLNGDGAFVRLRRTFAGGDSETLTIVKRDVNVPINLPEFKVVLPKTTKLIAN